MTNRLCCFCCLALTWLSTASCEKVASIEKKTLVPVTPPPTCSALLSATNSGLRVANLITTDSKLDVCVRPSGGQFPSTPLLRSGATGCPDGIAYGQYTMPLKIGTGSYDVKLVRAGSDCDADGPTVAAVTFDGKQSTSIFAYGTAISSATAGAKAYADATDVSNNVYVRFFHAENGQGSVDVNTGIIPLFSNVQFGSVANKVTRSAFPIDDFGYMVYPNSGNEPGALPMAALDTGTTNALIKSSVYLTKAHHYDLYLMGAAGDTTFKPRLWSCDEGVANPTGFFAECGDPRELKISIFHPNLTDLFTDYVSQRKDAAISNIALSTADVLCLPELYPPDVRDGIAHHLPSGTTATFSDDYTMSPKSNLNDADDQPVAWADKACDGQWAIALGALKDCLGGLPCVTTKDGDSDASVTKHYFDVEGSQAIGCVAGTGSGGCSMELAAFVIAPTHESDQCLMCAITHLSSGDSFEDMYSACTASTAGKPHYVYGGKTGLALITKFQGVADDSPEVIYLPSSNWNRAALRVPLTLANNSVVDFWCADVRAPNSELFLTNGGPYYGNAQAGDALGGNSAEERLQIDRLITAVNQQATESGRRAVVLALTYSSPRIVDANGAELVSALVPENYDLFQQSNWQELVARSWTPTCTWCDESRNPLNGKSDNQAIVHMFGVGIGGDSVTDTALTFTSNNLQMSLYDGTPVNAPVSQYYGLQSTVRVTQ